MDLSAVANELARAVHGLASARRALLDHLAVALAGGRDRLPCLVGPPGTGRRTLARGLSQATGWPLKVLDLRRPGTALPPPSQPAVHLLVGLRPDAGHALLADLADRRPAGMLLLRADHEADLPDWLHREVAIIPTRSYTRPEKRYLVQQVVLPRLSQRFGIQVAPFDDQAAAELVERFGQEPGVQQLVRRLEDAVRERAGATARGDASDAPMTPDELLAGCRPGPVPTGWSGSELGMALGLGLTGQGGEVTPFEAVRTPGAGRLQVNGSDRGQLASTARQAYCYVQSRAAQLELDPHTLRTTDVHVQLVHPRADLEVGSLGLPLVLALTSLLSDKPARMDVGLVGQITVRGRVLAVNGLTERLFAAYRAGLRKVLFPAGQLDRVPELPPELRQALELHPVGQVADIFPITLIDIVIASSQQLPEFGAKADRPGV